MEKVNIMLGMFVGVILVIGIVVFFTTISMTAELETISLDTKPITDTVEKVGTLEKYYNVSSETVTIKSYDTKTELAKIRLDTPIDYKVGAGYQKVAQITISPKTDISSFIKQIELYNLKDNSKSITRPIDYKYLSVGTKKVIDYTTECTEKVPEFKSQEEHDIFYDKFCKVVVSGSHQEDEWLNYDGNLVTDKEIILGLFTEVQIGDKVEWVPTFNTIGTDVRVSEWATWTESLNTNLNLYYDCNSPTERVSGSLNLQNYEGTMNYTTNGALIGKSCRFTTDNNIKLANSSLTNIRNSYGTANFWFKVDDVAGAEDYLWSNDADWNYNQQWHNSNYLYSTGFIDGGAKTNGGTITSGTWHMLTYLYNSSGAYIYKDGAIMYSGAITSTNKNNFPYKFGSANDGSNNLNGYMDEISFWSRALTHAEIIQLYNGGAGMPYKPTCNFSGYVKDSAGGGLDEAEVVIFNQNNKSEIYNTTTDENGYWSKDVVNSTSNFVAVAYYNNTLVGSAKPFISGTC